MNSLTDVSQDKTSEQAGGFILVRAARISKNIPASCEIKPRGSFISLLLVIEPRICLASLDDASSFQPLTKVKVYDIVIDFYFGAGGENRTRIACLEGTYISHYTTPATELLYPKLLCYVSSSYGQRLARL